MSLYNVGTQWKTSPTAFLYGLGNYRAHVSNFEDLQDEDMTFSDLGLALSVHLLEHPDLVLPAIRLSMDLQGLYWTWDQCYLKQTQTLMEELDFIEEG